MTAGGSWEVDRDSALGRALLSLDEITRTGDRARIDAAFGEAVRLAHDVGLAAAIAAQHVDVLRHNGNGHAALDRCTSYRARFPGSARLALVAAETRVALGDPSRIEADLVAAAALSEPRRDEDEARRVRLEGIAARVRREYGRSRVLLEDALDRYRRLGDIGAVAVVEDDLRGLAGPGAPPPGPDPGARTPAAVLTRSESLRLSGRYEQALDELAVLLDGSLDPVFEFAVTEARVRLLWILHRDAEAECLAPDLDRAAERSADPARDRFAAARLKKGPGDPVVVAAAKGRGLQEVRVLVEAGHLAAAEERLRAEAHPPEPDRWHEAEWHLAAGELTLAHARAGDPAAPAAAVTHLERAAELAAEVPFPPLVVAARRRLGQVHKLRGDLPAAVRAWAGAHAEEERIAALQRTDETRIGFLTAVPDEFDEQVRVAADAIRDDPRQVAAVAVAIEAARGAALLGRVLPEELADRALPGPGDVIAARAWTRRARRHLPRRQVVWLVHATPDAVHHVLVGRTRMWHVRHDADRNRLREQVGDLCRCYGAGGRQLYQRQGEFAARTDAVACTLGVDRVLAAVPGRVRRIAVVAGAELSDVPFAALPCPSASGAGRDLLGRRYALSDLPCLSVRLPLRGRSAAQRGLRGLLVRPGAEAGPDRAPLADATVLPEHTVLAGPDASPDGLAAALGTGFRTVRLDCHGTLGGDERPASLHLARGDLTPERLAVMDLTGTGTVVLGACHSGMQTRRGRDERTGFVRSGLVAGASAALAARWQAEDATAAALLDAFEDELRRHPRDVALHRAVLAAESAVAAVPVGWAAWTLYGDPGPQTAAGPVRRGLARWRAARRGGGAG